MSLNNTDRDFDNVLERILASEMENCEKAQTIRQMIKSHYMLLEAKQKEKIEKTKYCFYSIISIIIGIIIGIYIYHNGINLSKKDVSENNTSIVIQGKAFEMNTSYNNTEGHIDIKQSSNKPKT